MKARWRFWLLLLALAGVSTWLALAPVRQREPERTEAVAVEFESPRPTPPPPPAAAGTPEPEPPQPQVKARTNSEPRDVDPHPFTPERAQLQRELQLIAAINDAMDLGDTARMRELIERYREQDPRDEHGLQEGYAIIAACLDKRDEDSRARAQQYYDTERASGLRRYVRRHCLE